ncbi:MAG: sel1 repeat family protein [Magnetococcales bacterium]|nr:sel1 repeat family protein [Magnetococcales bacterium]
MKCFVFIVLSTLLAACATQDRPVAKEAGGTLSNRLAVVPSQESAQAAEERHPGPVPAVQTWSPRDGLAELLQSAEGGHVGAQHNLGMMYLFGNGVAQDYVQAARWFGKAAGQGLAKAQYALGLLYAKGDGLPQAYEDAARWFGKAAGQGHPLGQKDLGVLYAEGKGVAQDYTHAYMWLTLAAAQGDRTSAQFCEIIAKQMSPEQVAQAKEMARNWRPVSP